VVEEEEEEEEGTNFGAFDRRSIVLTGTTLGAEAGVARLRLPLFRAGLPLFGARLPLF
jgi:hypothetical protein